MDIIATEIDATIRASIARSDARAAFKYVTQRQRPETRHFAERLSTITGSQLTEQNGKELGMLAGEAHTPPPFGGSRRVYDGVSATLQAVEGVNRTAADKIAAQAAAFFSSEEDVLVYMKRWTPPATAKPLLHMLGDLRLPEKFLTREAVATRREDLREWKDAALQVGPKMLAAAQHADLVDRPGRVTEKEYSLRRTFESIFSQINAGHGAHRAFPHRVAPVSRKPSGKT